MAIIFIEAPLSSALVLIVTEIPSRLPVAAILIEASLCLPLAATDDEARNQASLSQLR